MPMEIPESIKKLTDDLAIYTLALKDYSTEQFYYKKQKQIWSLAQLYEHLHITSNFFFLKNIKYCIEQRNGQLGGLMTDIGLRVFAQGSFPPIKVKVPFAEYEDPSANTISYYKLSFGKTTQQIQQQQAAIQASNPLYKTSHIVFGMLNACEWLQAYQMHHRHHLRQKTELETYLNTKP
jgi:hypothetical protein